MIQLKCKWNDMRRPPRGPVWSGCGSLGSLGVLGRGLELLLFNLPGVSRRETEAICFSRRGDIVLPPHLNNFLLIVFQRELGVCTPLPCPEDIRGITTAEWPLLERKCQCFPSEPSITSPFKHTPCVRVWSETNISKSQASNSVHTVTRD